MENIQRIQTFGEFLNKYKFINDELHRYKYCFAISSNWMNEFLSLTFIYQDDPYNDIDHVPIDNQSIIN